MIVGGAPLKRFSKKRGQSCRVAPTDMLFILPTTSESGVSWQFCAGQFKIPVSAFRRLLWPIMEAVGDDFPNHTVLDVEKKHGRSFWNRQIVYFHIIRTLDVPLTWTSINWQDHLVPLTISNTGTVKNMRCSAWKRKYQWYWRDGVLKEQKRKGEYFWYFSLGIFYPGTAHGYVKTNMTSSINARWVTLLSIGWVFLTRDIKTCNELFVHFVLLRGRKEVSYVQLKSATLTGTNDSAIVENFIGCKTTPWQTIYK